MEIVRDNISSNRIEFRPLDGKMGCILEQFGSRHSPQIVVSGMSLAYSARAAEEVGMKAIGQCWSAKVQPRCQRGLVTGDWW